MLLVGMDVSGDEDHANYLYLGIVIGTNESILSLSANLGSYPEHMSRILESKQNEIIEKLSFDSRNRIAFCVKLDRKRIITEMKSLRRCRKIRDGDIQRTYDMVVIQEIKRRIESFLFSHNQSITDIEIQCDNDMVRFAKAGSIKHTRKGAAYRISDYVAWCNNKNRNVDSVIEIDFTADIPGKMKGILGLN